MRSYPKPHVVVSMNIRWPPSFSQANLYKTPDLGPSRDQTSGVLAIDLGLWDLGDTRNTLQGGAGYRVQQTGQAREGVQL